MRAVGPVGSRAVALVAVAAFGLAACSSSSKTSSSTATSAGSSGGGGGGGTVKLGFFGALTGPNAQLGINIENGEKLAISQYNATNPKTKVTLDPFDSQGDPSQANNGATKLINDKVVGVLGPAFSGESAAADPIFESAGIPNVSASATNTKLAENGWKYFHRVVADDSLQGPADADYLAKTLHLTSVAVIDDNSTYGKGLGDAVRGQLTKVGAKDVLDDHVDPNGADYGSTVNKIVSSNATAVFFGGYYDAAGRLVKQLRAAGYKGVFMSGDGSEDARFVSDAGGSPAEGAYLSCPCADVTSESSAASFVSAYNQMFGTPPQIYSAEAYDATNFMLAAIKGGNTTPSAINKYLGDSSWKGVTKTVKFQSNGNIAGGTIFVYKVESGKIVQIGTTS
ncbi:MAG TPA: branched-chain amino acid ABC transporter substrate-binding protein [Acidimicrobiales bacterium]|nr:branched-chain amino acid ABC transporter substrate-binding protein [Acidimicrobiales bacterium]